MNYEIRTNLRVQEKKATLLAWSCMQVVTMKDIVETGLHSGDRVPASEQRVQEDAASRRQASTTVFSL